MSNLFLLVIVITVATIGLILALSKRARQEIAGICAAALGQTAKKNANKERILALLQERGELSNSEIREILGVVRRSVIRYMSELEKEGKVEQVGVTGRGVVYRLKN